MWDGPDNRPDVYYIDESHNSRLVGLATPHLAIWAILGPATISPCTITMDHDAIICSMIDRLTRGPDQMFTSRAWAAQSTLLGCRCHILVIDYRWGSMGSDETASTLWGPSGN